jgi:hypothetical protein
MTDSKRLSIKRSTYRGQDGWLIYGSGYGIFGTSIFTLSRSSAEHIREQVRAGVDTTVADFEPQAEYAHLDVPSG